MDINTATREDLSTLPGISEARVSKIISTRCTRGPFTKENLASVPGIPQNLLPNLLKQGLINISNEREGEIEQAALAQEISITQLLEEIEQGRQQCEETERRCQEHKKRFEDLQVKCNQLKKEVAARTKERDKPISLPRTALKKEIEPNRTWTSKYRRNLSPSGNLYKEKSHKRTRRI